VEPFPPILWWRKIGSKRWSIPTRLDGECLYNVVSFSILTSSEWAKSTKRQSEGVRSKYSAMLSKIHSYRLLLRWFCPLG